jgi:GT2 family glycosyltransferase
MKICAITVGFNNSLELKTLLHSVIPDIHDNLINLLIIIDNSDDQHHEDNVRLFDSDILRPYQQKVIFIKNEKNLGSAYGFYEGMRRAGEMNFDWVWLLDQDGRVERGALKGLLKYLEYGDVLCPAVIDNSNKLLIAFRCKINPFGGIYPIPGRYYHKKVVSMNIFGTHGVFISSKILHEVGLYDPRNFFSGNEDYDFSYRIIQKGFKITLITDSHVYHPDKINKFYQAKGRLFFPPLWIFIRKDDIDKLPIIYYKLSLLYVLTKYLRFEEFIFCLIASFPINLLLKILYYPNVIIYPNIRLLIFCMRMNYKKNYNPDSVSTDELLNILKSKN